jgi:peptidoglycan/LPS O-acetylase OafA/YrhL
LLVVLVAFRPAIEIFRILDLSIVRFFGRISYSFYLLHPIGITVAARSIEVGGSFDLITIVATTVLAIAITTPIAWLSWYCVERPFIALGKRFDRDQRRGPVDVAAAELIPLVVPNRRR